LHDKGSTVKTPLSIPLVQADPHPEPVTPPKRALLRRVLRDGRWRGGLLVCGLLLAPAHRAGPLDFELYTDSTAFSARVGPDIRRVTFDDISTPPDGYVAFEASRYAASHGIVMSARGGGGQYVSQTFGWPAEFKAVSQPNVYAPGPINGGEQATVVTFYAGNLRASVAGFGLWFLDPDWPDWPELGMGACKVTAYDAVGKELFSSPVVSGPNASQVFCGIVAVDAKTRLPAPGIARLVIRAGSGWPAISSGEGAPMDDFIFDRPTPLLQIIDLRREGTAGTVDAGGVPGTTVWLQCTKDLGAPDWQDIGTKTIEDTGQVTFADLPVSGSQLFYRLVTQ